MVRAHFKARYLKCGNSVPPSLLVALFRRALSIDAANASMGTMWHAFTPIAEEMA